MVVKNWHRAAAAGANSVVPNAPPVTHLEQALTAAFRRQFTKPQGWRGSNTSVV